jgi:hypothetical protein
MSGSEGTYLPKHVKLTDDFSLSSSDFLDGGIWAGCSFVVKTGVFSEDDQWWIQSKSLSSDALMFVSGLLRLPM